jgi:hypothetical protein
MKAQEVILKAAAGKLKWWEAAPDKLKTEYKKPGWAQPAVSLHL